jgi:hypothetical protein
VSLCRPLFVTMLRARDLLDFGRATHGDVAGSVAV